jgi:head-tail adaptor
MVSLVSARDERFGCEGFPPFQHIKRNTKMTEFSGALRERVGVERSADVRDALAGFKGKYRYDGAVWAAVTPLMPAELSAGDAISALPRWQVRVRKREDYNQRMRLTWRGRTLYIRSIISDPRKPAELLLMCEEKR